MKPDLLEKFARAGYFAKGIIYATVGMLLLLAVFGNAGDGDVSGTRGAVRAIGEQPFGKLLVAVLVIGIVGYAAWRLTQAVKDTENKGTSATGLMQRLGFTISAFFYASLAFYAVKQTGVISSGSSSGSTKQTLIAQLMSYEWGILAVGIAGAVFAALGAYQFYRAFSRKFVDSWKTQRISQDKQNLLIRIAQGGILARSITFFMIGALVINAAIRADPSQAKGLGKALQSLQDEPFGTPVLAMVGAGLICYGFYCFCNARYREIDA